MISEKLLALIGETEKLDELKEIMNEIDVVEAKNTELSAQVDSLKNHVSELNSVNAKLLLSSTLPENDGEEKADEDFENCEASDILGMSDETFDAYMKKVHPDIE